MKGGGFAQKQQAKGAGSSDTCFLHVLETDLDEEHVGHFRIRI